jgi:CheY-like chemotaxis protein
MQKNGSILVVDDEEIMREILETLLKAEGYSVRLAPAARKGSSSHATSPSMRRSSM